MMGFARKPAPRVIESAKIITFVGEKEIAGILCADPHRIDDPCPFNATGHEAIGSCGDVVCCHCSRVFW